MKRSKPFLKRLDERGSSLIESMVAMVMLSTGLMAVGQMVPAGLMGVNESRARINAVQAAQERLETVRSSDFDSAALIAGTYSETMGRYTVDWTIQDDVPVPGSKRVNITASWDTPRGTRDIRLTTHVTAR